MTTRKFEKLTDENVTEIRQILAEILDQKDLDSFVEQIDEYFGCYDLINAIAVKSAREIIACGFAWEDSKEGRAHWEWKYEMRRERIYLDIFKGYWTDFNPKSKVIQCSVDATNNFYISDLQILIESIQNKDLNKAERLLKFLNYSYSASLKEDTLHIGCQSTTLKKLQAALEKCQAAIK